MDWITERIYIGDVDDAMRPQELSGRGITAILSLNGFPTFLPEDGFTWRRVLLKDGEGNTPEELQRAVTTLAALTSEHNVLVHCMSGVSRAPFVVACYLAENTGLSLKDAIEEVAKRRPRTQVNPALLDLYEDAHKYGR